MSRNNLKATCPKCGRTNAMRASNDHTQIYCGNCGWVEDT